MKIEILKEPTDFRTYLQHRMIENIYLLLIKVTRSIMGADDQAFICMYKEWLGTYCIFEE